MELFSLKSIKNITGIYELETDGDIYFHWFSNSICLELASEEDGIFYIEGESPVDNTIHIQNNIINFTRHLEKNSPILFNIPYKQDKNQKIYIKFSNFLKAEGDTRVLSFKVYKAGWPSSKSHIRQCTHLPQVENRGLPGGHVSTVFAEGWLRMNVVRDQRQLRLSGILFPPLKDRETPILYANEEPIKNITYNLFNKEYSFLGTCAFEGTLALQDDTSDTIRFSAYYPKTHQKALSWSQEWAFPLQNRFPLPSPEHMRRIGAGSEDWYLFSGKSFAIKLNEIISRFHTAEKLQDVSILDWGCGCGRLTRHLLEEGSENVLGIDIDPVNIEWCKHNLSESKFLLVSPEAPTGIPSDSYDLIIAHSVMTHLAEEDQFIWLAEMQRLLKPGGLAVFTVLGNYSASIEQFDYLQYIHLLEYGFIDLGWQNDGVDIQKPGFYRRVFHTYDYIITNWSCYFDVKAILEGFSDHQTAIILKK